MGLRHLRALDAVGIDVIAVADRREAAICEAKEEAPHAVGYTDWRKVIDHHRPDLLIVATTSPAHAAVVIAAAEGGARRLLCEKPIASSIHDGRAMIDTCHQRSARLLVNHPRRLLPVYLNLRDAIDGGRFGDLRFMRVTCGAAGLGNIGSHAFDLIRWFLGEPEQAVGWIESQPFQNPRGADFHDPGGHGIFLFGDDRRATFDFSNDFSTSFCVEFGCRYGSIVVDERACQVRAFARDVADRSEPQWLYQTATVPVDLSFGDSIDLVAMTAAMIRDAMRDGRPACAGEDGLAALEMVAAVHLSHRAHAPVRFPISSDEGCLARIP
jgi:predicted dehydrogenase